MAVTMARNASERSFIISLTDSFICCSPPFDGLIIAHNIVPIKRKEEINLCIGHEKKVKGELLPGYVPGLPEDMVKVQRKAGPF